MLRKIGWIALFVLPTLLVVGVRVGLAWVGQYDFNSSAVSRSEGWIDDIHQVTSRADRDDALDEVREILRARDDRRAAEAAMLAIVRTSTVQYDRTELRELLEPYVIDKALRLDVNALAALASFDPRPVDLDRALAACRAALGSDAQAELPMYASQLALLDEGHVRSEAARLVIAGLEGDDPNAIDRVVRGLWGVKPSEDLVDALATLLERCEQHGNDRDWNDLAYNVLYYGFTTFDEAPVKAIDVMLAELRDGQRMNASRFVWAFRRGVPEERAHAVASELAAQYDAGNLGDDVFALVGHYGDVEHRAWLAEIAEHPRAVERIRQTAAAAVTRYDERER